MASRAKRKRKARPKTAARPARPPASVPPAYIRPPAPVPGEPARPAPDVPAAYVRAAAPVSKEPVAQPAGTGGCAGAGEYAVLRHALTVTCWVDPGDSGMEYDTVIRFSGRRLGVTGRPSPGDRFERDDLVRLVPGSGPVAVTTRVQDISAGQWQVRARPADRHGPGRVLDPASLWCGRAVRRMTRILWPKGNPVPADGRDSAARTRIFAFATVPGIIPGAWAGLVLSGLVVALAVLAALLARVQVSAGGALGVGLAASVVGLAGARGWYVMLQRGKVSGLPTQGLCIQGFVAGAVLAGVPGLLLAGIPVGTFFDAAAPGLFFAMAIGRQGCFLAGCCAGRVTGSRLGIWSSDGNIGARRLPAQHLELLASLLIGAAALAAFLQFGRSAGGSVFAGALAAYILARQGLLSFRAEPRRWSLARPVTAAAASAALLADILISAMR